MSLCFRFVKENRDVGQMINMLNEAGQTGLGFVRRTRAQPDTMLTDTTMALKRSIGSGGTHSVERRIPMRDFSRSLPMSLLRAREAVMKQFRPSLRRHGLTEQQWRILRALAAVDAIEVTELAHVAFLLGPSLSRILRDLEARQLIDRRTAKADHRRGVVSISQKGLKLIELVAPTSEAIYAAISQRYGARKLAELQDMLAALEDSLAMLELTDSGAER
jgi:homoprotocatechuate degradation regulator HpaR